MAALLAFLPPIMRIRRLSQAMLGIRAASPLRSSHVVRVAAETAMTKRGFIGVVRGVPPMQEDTDLKLPPLIRAMMVDGQNPCSFLYGRAENGGTVLFGLMTYREYTRQAELGSVLRRPPTAGMDHLGKSGGKCGVDAADRRRWHRSSVDRKRP